MTRMALGSQISALLPLCPAGREGMQAVRSAEEAVKQWSRRARRDATEEPPVLPAEEEESWEQLEGLYDSRTPPLRKGKTIKVRFVLGDKLPPRPYPLDEELWDWEEE